MSYPFETEPWRSSGNRGTYLTSDESLAGAASSPTYAAPGSAPSGPVLDDCMGDPDALPQSYDPFEWDMANSALDRTPASDFDMLSPATDFFDSELTGFDVDSQFDIPPNAEPQYGEAVEPLPIPWEWKDDQMGFHTEQEFVQQPHYEATSTGYGQGLEEVYPADIKAVLVYASETPQAMSETMNFEGGFIDIGISESEPVPAFHADMQSSSIDRTMGFDDEFLEMGDFDPLLAVNTSMQSSPASDNIQSQNLAWGEEEDTEAEEQWIERVVAAEILSRPERDHAPSISSASSSEPSSATEDWNPARHQDICNIGLDPSFLLDCVFDPRNLEQSILRAGTLSKSDRVDRMTFLFREIVRALYCLEAAQRWTERTSWHKAMLCLDTAVQEKNLQPWGPLKMLFDEWREFCGWAVTHASKWEDMEATAEATKWPKIERFVRACKVEVQKRHQDLGDLMHQQGVARADLDARLHAALGAVKTRCAENGLFGRDAVLLCDFP